MIPLLLLLLQASQATALSKGISKIHPPIPMLDSAGIHVTESGAPLSVVRTCGACHDTDFISDHSFHATAGADRLGPGRGPRPWDQGPGWFGRWDPRVNSLPGPLAGNPKALKKWIATYGLRHPGGGPATAVGEELDCFLCHMKDPDLEARNEALKNGLYPWAASATLGKTGLLSKSGNVWIWRKEEFDQNGAVSAGKLRLQAPTSVNCAACHGEVRVGESPVQIAAGAPNGWMTGDTGQVFAGQRISDSGMNIQGKNALARPWDVHAARMLSCTDCHYSLNNPIYRQEEDRSRPPHLRFDARRMDFAEFLERPLHQFAKGQPSGTDSAAEFDDSMRRCESCHDSGVGHDWLPYAAEHFKKLACEACHIPAAHTAARESLDWTMLDSDGQPLTVWRGLEGDPADPVAYQEGFLPVLLPRIEKNGPTRLMPYNLLTTWYWVSGSPPVPVDKEVLQKALFLPEGGLRPEVLKTFDADGDGRIDSLEARLDSPEKAGLVRGLLVQAGVVDPKIRGDVEPHAMSHGVAGGKYALRDCSACHSRNSRIYRPIALAGYRPEGAGMPLPVAASTVRFDGEIVSTSSGSLDFAPSKAREDLYILGRDSSPFLDDLGVAIAIIILLAVGVHGGMRILAGRRNGNGGE